MLKNHYFIKDWISESIKFWDFKSSPFKAEIFNFDISDEILYMGIIDFRGLKNQFSLKYVISGGARNLKGNTRVPIPRLT